MFGGVSGLSLVRRKINGSTEKQKYRNTSRLAQKQFQNTGSAARLLSHMDRNSEPQSRIPHLLRLQAGNYQSGCVTPSLAASFKLDEGYADETRSQPDNEINVPLAGAMTLPEWVLAHREGDRAGTLRGWVSSQARNILTRVTFGRACIQHLANLADVHGRHHR